MELWKPEKPKESFRLSNLMILLFQFIHNYSPDILFQGLNLSHSRFDGLWGYK